MFELIVISHEAMLPGEAAIIQQLFEAGLEIFHLRKPDADEQAVRALLDAIPAVYHRRIALHGFFQLANEYDILRLHFTEEHLKKVGYFELGEPPRHIYSTSVHDLQTVQLLPSYFSYTFFSPVFDSISKQGYKGVTDDAFYLSNENKTVPVIALGGIDAENIQKVADMNFDGAAVLGTIWNEPAKAVDNFKLLKKQQELIRR